MWGVKSKIQINTCNGVCRLLDPNPHLKLSQCTLLTDSMPMCRLCNFTVLSRCIVTCWPYSWVSIGPSNVDEDWMLHVPCKQNSLMSIVPIMLFSGKCRNPQMKQRSILLFLLSSIVNPLCTTKRWLCWPGCWGTIYFTNGQRKQGITSLILIWTSWSLWRHLVSHISECMSDFRWSLSENILVPKGIFIICNKVYVGFKKNWHWNVTLSVRPGRNYMHAIVQRSSLIRLAFLMCYKCRCLWVNHGIVFEHFEHVLKCILN